MKELEKLVEEFRELLVSKQETYGIKPTPDYYDDEMCDFVHTALQSAYEMGKKDMEGKLNEIEKGAVKMLGAVIQKYCPGGVCTLEDGWEIEEGVLEREHLSQGGTELRARPKN